MYHFPMTMVSHEISSPPDIELFKTRDPLPGQETLFGLVLPPMAHSHNVEVNMVLPLEIESPERRKLRPDVFAELPITQLNAIVQARDEYEGIETLAEGIEEEGILIHNPLVARFDKLSARRYLEFVNGIYGNKVEERRTVADLVSTREGEENAYYIVIAGHRRLKALQIIGEEQVTVKVLENIDPLDALYLQAQENTPKLLKDYERSEQHGRLWSVSKARDPKLTLREFSRNVGTTEDVLRRDLRYYSLPDSVKNYVVPRNRIEGDAGNTIIPDQPLMPFNVACQLGRLVEKGAGEHDILFLARRFFEENITSERAASERVSHYIKNSIDGASVDMVDLFNVNAAQLARHRRSMQVAGRFAAPLDSAIAYFNRVRSAQDMGIADSIEDGLSLAGAANRLRDLADVMEGLLPSMKNMLNGDSERILETMRDVRDNAQKIEQTMNSERESGIFLQEGVVTPISESETESPDLGISA